MLAVTAKLNVLAGKEAEFEKAMKYLKDGGYKVIAMRDLAAYVDVKKAIKLVKGK